MSRYGIDPSGDLIFELYLGTSVELIEGKKVPNVGQLQNSCDLLAVHPSSYI